MISEAEGGKRKFCRQTARARIFKWWRNSSSSIISHVFPPFPAIIICFSVAFGIQTPTKMDVSELAKKLGLSDSKLLVRKAAELRRLCDVQFDSSVIGVVSPFPFLFIPFYSIRFDSEALCFAFSGWGCKISHMLGNRRH